MLIAFGLVSLRSVDAHPNAGLLPYLVIVVNKVHFSCRP